MADIRLEQFLTEIRLKIVNKLTLVQLLLEQLVSLSGTAKLSISEIVVIGVRTKGHAGQKATRTKKHWTKCHESSFFLDSTSPDNEDDLDDCHTIYIIVLLFVRYVRYVIRTQHLN